MKFKFWSVLLFVILWGCHDSNSGSQLNHIFQFQEGVKSRWVSFENPTGEIGEGGKRNAGAKGAAMEVLEPGELRTFFDIEGTGIINRMWMTGTFVHNPADRRNIIVEIYWDGDSTPAVSVPIHDFFGMGLPVKKAFESELFSQPEGRSYCSFVQMPFHKSAKMVIRNETEKKHMFYFDVNFSMLDKLPENSLYFHAYWNRSTHTKLKEDFEILPKVNGKGRFLGTNVGVICDSVYHDTWFGEGEVKIFLDGDSEYPTLCGTGTEDYVGTSWSQFPFANQTQGSPIADPEKGFYAFYRYHTIDPIFFDKDCQVSIQQMGNAFYDRIVEMKKEGVEMEIISVWDADESKLYRINEGDCTADINSPDFIKGWTNFWRSDDVCATAYFYLNKTSTNLPAIQGKPIRNYNSNDFN